MREVKYRLAHEPLVERAVDRVIQVFAPSATLKRKQSRARLRNVQRIRQRVRRKIAHEDHYEKLGYKTAINSRLDRASRRSTSWRDRYDRRDGSRLSGSVSGDLADRAVELTEDNPTAESVVLRLAERIVGPHIRFVARTEDKGWNSKHAELWGEWVDDADIRDMSSLYGLFALLVACQLTQNRCGIVLHDTGRLQLIEGVRIQTPPKESSNPNVVDGVQLNRFGRPIGFFVADDPEGMKTTYKRVPANDFVYFPLRRRYGDTIGKTIFASCFDNYEQIDAVVEGVTSAAQMAANFGLIFRREGGSDIIGETVPGTNSEGDPARVIDIEPAMVEWISGDEGVEQVKPEHPKQNLVDFLRYVMRIAGLPAGVPLEVLLQDYSNLTFHGGRAMHQAFDDWAECYRSWYLYKGLRRIYRWRTSKWIKEGLLSERPDAWRHKIIPPRRFVIEPDREQKSEGMALDFRTTTYTELAEKRGMTRDELFDAIQEDETELRSRGLIRMASNQTRSMNGKAEPVQSSQDSSE